MLPDPLLDRISQLHDGTRTPKWGIAKGSKAGLRGFKATRGTLSVRDDHGPALEALARRLEAKPADHSVMFEYRPRATHGDY